MLFRKNKEVELEEIPSMNLEQVKSDLASNPNVRYAILRPHRYATKDDNDENGSTTLNTKDWSGLEGFWNIEIKDVLEYIEQINRVDYKFGDGETLIRYEIVPVKHESKLTHTYTIGY